MAALPNLGIDPSFQMPAPKPSGGMFGGNGGFGLKEALAMGLAGFVSRRNPMLLQGLMQALMLKQKQKQDEAQYQRERDDKFTDFQKQYDYELTHPKPSTAGPHYFESNSGDQYAIGPDGQPQEVFHDPLRYKLVPNGMGGVVPVSIESLMGGGQLPTKPVGKITPIGGPTPQASGGFPGY